jgi:hypothetical protein
LLSIISLAHSLLTKIKTKMGGKPSQPFTIRCANPLAIGQAGRILTVRRSPPLRLCRFCRITKSPIRRASLACIELVEMPVSSLSRRSGRPLTFHSFFTTHVSPPITNHKSLITNHFSLLTAALSLAVRFQELFLTFFDLRRFVALGTVRSRHHYNSRMPIRHLTY